MEGNLPHGRPRHGALTKRAGLERAQAFIRANTSLSTPPHVPQIMLHLACEAHDLWHRTEEEPHKGVQRTLAALNKLYKEEPALYEKSFDPEGFEWVDFNDTESSVISFLRKGNNPGEAVLVVCNLTPVPRENYRIGIPEDGSWRELFNSDDQNFGGSNVKNPQVVNSEALPVHGKDHSVALTLPPMGVVYLKKDKSSTGSNRPNTEREKE